MTAFSRGLRPRLQCIVKTYCVTELRTQPTAHCAPLSRAPSGCPKRRLFHASIYLRAAAAQPPPTPPSTSAQKPNPSTPSYGTFSRPRPPVPSYAELLASRGSPTSLYEVPSQLWPRLGAFGGGFFSVSYVVVQYWSLYLVPPPDPLPWWVPPAFGAICMFMSGMAVYFARGVGNVVASIRALPSSSFPSALQHSSSRTAAAAAAGSLRGRQPQLRLEVKVQRAIPLIPDRVLVCAPEEIVLPARAERMLAVGVMAREKAGVSQPSELERLRAARSEAERRAAARQYELDHVMTAPMRDAGRGARTVWGGIKRIFLSDPSVMIRVKGQSMKLVLGGWALEDGRALDRIVPVRPNEFIKTPGTRMS